MTRSPTPAASPYRNVLRERVDTLHKRLSEGGAPTPAPDDDDAATLSPGGKLRAELSRRASERVAVAVSDMRQKLAELDGAAVPESDVARAGARVGCAASASGQAAGRRPGASRKRPRTGNGSSRRARRRSGARRSPCFSALSCGARRSGSRSRAPSTRKASRRRVTVTVPS